MKITFAPTTVYREQLSKDLTSLRFFRATSSATPDRPNSVFIKMNDTIYRLSTDTGEEFIVHSHINDNRVIFTDVYYLSVELICKDLTR